ncbi:MAG TPA: hypothetical protein DEV81_19790 [Cyanobacteria bacterium UBA11049]|nr:hypothetical protein [Cyanobacteria bacterium UBA11049]
MAMEVKHAVEAIGGRGLYLRPLILQSWHYPALEHFALSAVFTQVSYSTPLDWIVKHWLKRSFGAALTATGLRR